MDLQFVVSVLFQLAFLAVAFFGFVYDARRSKCGKSNFLQKDYSVALKAICCFMTIFMHFGFSDKYQLLGCGAWIGVTFFFFFSGYGLSFVASKNDYTQTFFCRILKISAPYVVALFLQKVICGYTGGGVYFM